MQMNCLGVDPFMNSFLCYLLFQISRTSFLKLHFHYYLIFSAIKKRLYRSDKAYLITKIKTLFFTTMLLWLHALNLFVFLNSDWAYPVFSIVMFLNSFCFSGILEENILKYDLCTNHKKIELEIESKHIKNVLLVDKKQIEVIKEFNQLDYKIHDNNKIFYVKVSKYC